MRIEINAQTLELHQGDITLRKVDAIVNAANSRLAGGGGVDGAIHRRGGPAIMAETNEKFPDGCPTGSAVISTAGKLPAKWVIHAVGPVWSGGHRGEAELLAAAVRRCLELAVAHECRSIALPALSRGLSLSYGPGRAGRLGRGDRLPPRTAGRNWCGLCSSTPGPTGHLPRRWRNSRNTRNRGCHAETRRRGGEEKGRRVQGEKRDTGDRRDYFSTTLNAAPTSTRPTDQSAS